MNLKRYNLLRYLLVILLIIAPLRSVLAEQGSHCDMANMSAEMATDSIHHMHHMEQASSHTGKTEQAPLSHNCCCCEGNSCASNCEMSVSASIFMQASSYVPVFVSAADTVLYSSDVLARALAPPSRPPLNLS